MNLLFDPGTVLISIPVWKYLGWSIKEINFYVGQHVAGQYGIVSPSLWDLNDAVLKDHVEGNIRSKYLIGSWVICITTNLKRGYTTIIFEAEKPLYPPWRKNAKRKSSS